MHTPTLTEFYTFTTFERHAVHERKNTQAMTFHKLQDELVSLESRINLPKNQKHTRFLRNELTSDSTPVINSGSLIDITVPLKVKRKYRVRAKVVKRSKFRAKPVLDF